MLIPPPASCSLRYRNLCGSTPAPSQRRERLGRDLGAALALVAGAPRLVESGEFHPPFRLDTEARGFKLTGRAPFSDCRLARSRRRGASSREGAPQGGSRLKLGPLLPAGFVRPHFVGLSSPSWARDCARSLSPKRWSSVVCFTRGGVDRAVRRVIVASPSPEVWMGASVREHTSSRRPVSGQAHRRSAASCPCKSLILGGCLDRGAVHLCVAAQASPESPWV